MHLNRLKKLEKEVVYCMNIQSCRLCRLIPVLLLRGIMKVLLSIRPEFAEKILSGKKKYEFRKVLPKAAGVKTIVIYATMPLGKVVGEFDIAEILTDTPTRLWMETKQMAGISRGYFNEYFDGRKLGHAIKVKRVRRYPAPQDLKSILPSGIAPQSFCYIS